MKEENPQNMRLETVCRKSQQSAECKSPSVVPEYSGRKTTPSFVDRYTYPCGREGKQQHMRTDGTVLPCMPNYCVQTAEAARACIASVLQLLWFTKYSVV